MFSKISTLVVKGTVHTNLVHSKEKLLKGKVRNIVYARQSEGIDSQNLFVGRTKQPLAKWMGQHFRLWRSCCNVM